MFKTERAEMLAVFAAICFNLSLMFWRILLRRCPKSDIWFRTSSSDLSFIWSSTEKNDTVYPHCEGFLVTNKSFTYANLILDQQHKWQNILLYHINLQFLAVTLCGSSLERRAAKRKIVAKQRALMFVYTLKTINDNTIWPAQSFCWSWAVIKQHNHITHPTTW